MLLGKPNLIVGITTFHNEMLRICVPALAKNGEKFLLVIYNDNPCEKITARSVRRLGYRGALKIINGHERVGTLRARMRIIRHASRAGRTDGWILFANDDDIVMNACIPTVGSNVFAIIQNAVAVRGSVSDLIRGVPVCKPGDADIVQTGANISITGTAIRIRTARGMCDILDTCIDGIREIDAGLDYAPPTDAMMWSFLNMYARWENRDAAPIYMDCVNYARNALGTAKAPIKNGATRRAHALARYDALFRAALDARR